ncbi:F-box/LRR-repeat MAX2 homolog A [Amborella trichopoda]|uniref:COI1 F-box domain-containing protein n=1 Tax=Amborella trichopoda TaxID=13333 RepID=W1Q0F2_AMBTC|nr:F-box/LRR-repeat MAX2 homolog A [Amborella trichopoda]ERN13876.1 hypothetical protein AMTR_s00021p00041390 [Amborella trichopoda]|eukprot:XP_006852409.1 F-box/LRR-repeat MAX2 homolog A [Amborella trichopoda]
MVGVGQGGEAETKVQDLPDAILGSIIGCVTETRSRNAVALVCRKWAALERSSRIHLSLRGHARELPFLPTSFTSISHLDLSSLSPWGHPLLLTSNDPSSLLLLARLLSSSFPNLTSLCLYARSPSSLLLLAPLWPNLVSVKLVRFHPRPPDGPPGSDFAPIFSHCNNLSRLDLSLFYCWLPDDLPPALEAHPLVASNLSSLYLLNPSTDAFKATQLLALAQACPNLSTLLASCVFDPRYVDAVGDAALVDLALACPKLSVLHLVDSSALSAPRACPDSAVPTNVTPVGLTEAFNALPLLRDFALDVRHNVLNSAPALEALAMRCPRLMALELGHFQGLLCPQDPRPSGLAHCHGLKSLSIKNSVNFSDEDLAMVSVGCPRLVKLELLGCPEITESGLRGVVRCLCRSLVDLRVSCCKRLDAVSTLCALEPICNQLQHLHIDCVWNQQAEFANNPNSNRFLTNHGEDEESCTRHTDKKMKMSSIDSDDLCYTHNGFYRTKTWTKLKSLSLWIAVGELLSPLVNAGLESCPALEEVRIKVEGDCRLCAKPGVQAFGLASLARYHSLTKLHLDCGDAVGYALSAPSGQMDLSLWERFYLNGIRELGITDMDYWPPQDREMNRRSVSLPGAGLLSESLTLRRLIIHGTTHEHFMQLLLRIPSLRDVQLREDYYPAPENDMSTEMRADSCRRFEEALSRRPIPD